MRPIRKPTKPTLKRHPSKKSCLRNSGATTTAWRLTVGEAEDRRHPGGPLRSSRRADGHAADGTNVIGSMIEGSSFSGLFTRVDVGHIRIGSDGNGRIKSRGLGSSLSQRV